MAQPLPLSEAVARAQRAYINLEVSAGRQARQARRPPIPAAHALPPRLHPQESIRNASRRLTDLELLRPRCVKLLGYDPAAAAAVSGGGTVEWCAQTFAGLGRPCCCFPCAVADTPCHHVCFCCRLVATRPALQPRSTRCQSQAMWRQAAVAAAMFHRPLQRPRQQQQLLLRTWS